MARKVTFSEREREYMDLWDSCEVRPSKVPQIDWHCGQIMKNRKRYQNVENVTGVPWWFVGLIHAMEASYRFDKHLHNGDSLQGKTRRVPSGRIPGMSPPYSWEASAADALTMPGKRYNIYTTWRIAEVAYRLEHFNGWGYYLYKGIESPYLWSYSNHYTRGKYVSDGKYSRSAVSGQAGAMAILKRLVELVPTIKPALMGAGKVPADAVDDLSEPPLSVEDHDLDPQPKAEGKPNLKKSRKWNLINWLKWLGGALGLGGLSVDLSSASGVAELQYYTMGMKSMWDTWGLVGLVVICVVIVLVATVVQSWMKEDAEEGRYTPSGDSEEEPLNGD